MNSIVLAPCLCVCVRVFNYFNEINDENFISETKTGKIKNEKTWCINGQGQLSNNKR